MLLKYAKVTNGAYKCPLVSAASELGIDAHAAHAELSQLHEAGILRLEMSDPAFYVRLRRVPAAGELSYLTARLVHRMATAEQLQRTKLDAAASLLWRLASHPDEGVHDTLSRYFCDGLSGANEWVAPVQRKPQQPTLRGDVADFVLRHYSAPQGAPGKARVKLNARAVARILHGLPSPAFPWKEWHGERCWGKYRDVGFDELRRVAEEFVETARRKERAHALEANRQKRRGSQ